MSTKAPTCQLPDAKEMCPTSHAGYTYSGACAAWAYKTLDLNKTKRIFLLGPSHTYSLRGCAATTYGRYATPFGNFTVDQETIGKIKRSCDVDEIPRTGDMAEHSLEMHLPYLWKRCEQTFADPSKFPLLVPMLVGSSSREAEKKIGKALAPFLKDPTNAFVISSDFCHWGDNFDYMVYSAEKDPAKLSKLSRSSPTPSGSPIHETIRAIDQAAMKAIETGKHDAFLDSLKMTQNTVCGRHPIGVAMAAMEEIMKDVADKNKARFKVVRYERSNLVTKPNDFSVSYVSAYAVL